MGVWGKENFFQEVSFPHEKNKSHKGARNEKKTGKGAKSSENRKKKKL